MCSSLKSELEEMRMDAIAAARMAAKKAREGK
jgi:hypothetical protein